LAAAEAAAAQAALTPEELAAAAAEAAAARVESTEQTTPALGPLEYTIKCYQKPLVLASTSAQGTYEKLSSGYKMRMQMDFAINDDDPNTVIDKNEVATMTICLPRKD